MAFNSDISKLKSLVDAQLETIFDDWINEVKKDDVLLGDAIGHVKRIVLAGGKRIRPALFYHGFLSGGGKKNAKVLKVAAAVELVHIFLLIHDDIIDRGTLRHGVDTINIHFASKFKKYFKKGDSEHFGNSVAIIVGDMVYAKAVQVITESGLDKKSIDNVIFELQKIVQRTIIGQSQDLQIENKRKVDEREVLKMYENKTARYTFEGPLHLGLLMAGCKNKNIYNSFSNYALPLGIAFQIQDDILGVFGNQQKVGKSTTSDIAEGKKTLMIIKAFEKANLRQDKILNLVLGKANAKISEIESVKEIIEETGALVYAKSIVDWHLNKAKSAFADAKIPPKEKEFFLGIIEFLKEREI